MKDSEGNVIKKGCRLKSSMHPDGIEIICDEVGPSTVALKSHPDGLPWVMTQEDLNHSKWVVSSYPWVVSSYPKATPP
jgi:hypothetical protein